MVHGYGGVRDHANFTSSLVMNGFEVAAFSICLSNQ
jgi:hypothetical protein